MTKEKTENGHPACIGCIFLYDKINLKTGNKTYICKNTKQLGEGGLDYVTGGYKYTTADYARTNPVMCGPTAKHKIVA